MNKYFLAEVQSHFKRQKKTDAIEVFLQINLKKEIKIDLGKNIHCELTMKSPIGKDHLPRTFHGSQLSYFVSKSINEKYGLISIFSCFTDNSRYKVTREFTRALIKRGIRLVALYTNQNTDRKILSGKDFIFPSKASFYSKLFDLGEIRKEMRRSVINNCKADKSGRYQKNVSVNHNVISRLYDEHGYEAISVIFDEIGNLADYAEKEETLSAINKVMLYFGKRNDKSFCKKLNNIL